MHTTAVLIPCYNEEATIGKVVREFRAALPDAVVYVYDNNSADRTADLAREEGAVVRHEPLQGKGHVVRRMFADIDADVYVMVDGDATYDAASAPRMIRRLLDEHLDMVVGTRLDSQDQEQFRHGHHVGNQVFSSLISSLFKRRLRDILSGYRVLSRRFVKSFPALATGFETETELTVHALELCMPIAEEETPYRSRPEGSDSKLRTFSDGWRIMLAALTLFKEIRPFRFFFVWFCFFAAVAALMAYPVLLEYFQTGFVPKFPTWIAAMSFMILAFLSLTCAFILDSVARGRRERKRLDYLGIPSLNATRSS